MINPQQIFFRIEYKVLLTLLLFKTIPQKQFEKII